MFLSPKRTKGNAPTQWPDDDTPLSEDCRLLEEKTTFLTNSLFNGRGFKGSRPFPFQPSWHPIKRYQSPWNSISLGRHFAHQRNPRRQRRKAPLDTVPAVRFKLFVSFLARMTQALQHRPKMREITNYERFEIEWFGLFFNDRDRWCIETNWWCALSPCCVGAIIAYRRRRVRAAFVQ